MKKEKNLKTKKLSINKYKPSKVKLFRDEWLKNDNTKETIRNKKIR